LAAVAFFLLTASGGCTGSTAGGAKMMRWIILVRSRKIQIYKIRYPHVVMPLKYEGKTVSDNVLDGVMSFFVFYIFTVAILAALLNMIGLDFSTAISGALTSVANVGPGVGNIIGPAGNFASLPDSAKWVLFFGMYVGRLEMLTVFVLLTRGFWREAV
jgi:trk system potassium uptake protein TrkH